MEQVLSFIQSHPDFQAALLCDTNPEYSFLAHDQRHNYWSCYETVLSIISLYVNEKNKEIIFEVDDPNVYEKDFKQTLNYIDDLKDNFALQIDLQGHTVMIVCDGEYCYFLDRWSGYNCYKLSKKELIPFLKKLQDKNFRSRFFHTELFDVISSILIYENIKSVQLDDLPIILENRFKKLDKEFITNSIISTLQYHYNLPNIKKQREKYSGNEDLLYFDFNFILNATIEQLKLCISLFKIREHLIDINVLDFRRYE